MIKIFTISVSIAMLASLSVKAEETGNLLGLEWTEEDSQRARQFIEDDDIEIRKRSSSANTVFDVYRNNKKIGEVNEIGNGFVFREKRPGPFESPSVKKYSGEKK